MLCCSLFACKLCVLCWWWWYKQKVLNYIHSSTACLVCTIILTVSDFLYLKKVLRTRLNNLLFYFCMLKIVLFHCLAFYICPWFVLVSSRLFLFAREAWIEGNQFEIMHCGLKWGKKRSFNSAVQNYRFYCIQYEEYIVANFTDGQCGEVFYFVPFNIFFYSKVYNFMQKH